MDNSTDDNAIPDYLWRVWANGKRKGAIARKAKALAYTALVFAAIGAGFYVLAAR